jgi:hypothetical protein
MKTKNKVKCLAAALLALAIMGPCASLFAEENAKGALPSIAQKTAGLRHHPGWMALDWDAASGKLYLEIPRWHEGRTPDFLLECRLPWGTGSTEIWLDRGQYALAHVVRFERSGPKILLIASNQNFRSNAADASQQLAVRQSFPESVLWGFKAEAESADGTVLVDATEFFLHDEQGVAERIASAQKRTGKVDSYKLDPTRSVLVPEGIKSFAKNLSVESELTFTASGPLEGRYVADVTPDAHALTVHEQIGFVELPPLDGSFAPRRFVPRAGYFVGQYRDMTAPLGQPLEQQFILRYRLIKKDPNCVTACEPTHPIQYYVDRGAPEPIRSALREGASWWDEAFQAAGWAKGSFRVDLLPEGADPMDVRYNMIQWVHRYTRGWSYGHAIADPRTGEILQGNVTLGSLRARQDFLIAESVLSPYTAGKNYTDSNNPMLQMVLQRIRQLGAHETGHTLGLAHNFAASHLGQNNSVMDYPHPYIALDHNGAIDLSHAYASGIGTWDKIAINYGYRQFTERQSEPTELDKILREADKAGEIFITDQDARPIGGAHPYAHLWDNGSDPVAELDRTLQVRDAALRHFGENAIPVGTPMAALEDTLVTVYLLHRYQTEAATRLIGGLDFRYNLRGDGQQNPQIVPAEQQRKALAAVLKTLSPQALTLPESLLAILPPYPPGYERTQESFAAHTGPTFDPLAAAESAATLTLKALLEPSRIARVVEYHDRKAEEPSLQEILADLSQTTARRATGSSALAREVARAVESSALESMLALATNPATSSQARAITRAHLEALLRQWSEPQPALDPDETAHRAALAERIRTFQKTPEKFVPALTVEAPPGMPIGDQEELDGDL